jgi:ABC-type dipeptide/oligopeptide/nickel transport system permease component
VATLGLAVPNFVVAMMLIIIFGVWLRWLPVAGSMNDVIPAILPVATLSFWSMAALLRFERSSTRETISRSFVLLARAKGLPERRVLTDHVLKNGILPVLTFGALQFSVLLSGSVITESVFGMPGLGRLALEAVQRRDTYLVEAVVTLAATFFIGINLLTDLLYAWLDPRVRLAARN